MKNLLTVVMLFVFSTALYAQKDVTKFLGIPVDGTKTAMIQKLKAKGFQYNSSGDYLTGEFNGRDVRISVVTNNNKVYRIMVVDDNNSDETSIKIRFNTLCRQFENNKKYKSMTDKEQTIPDDEDLSYEMTVNNKRYEAVYYQQLEITDSIAFAKEVRSNLLSEYTEEQLANPSDEIKQEGLEATVLYLMDLCLKKTVWFKIAKHAGEYYITMYYDNEYNHADGEDL